MKNFERYAVYFAPERDSLLAGLGNQWLGFDPESGLRLERPVVGNLDASEIERITKAPSRYGFHGTLKAPFFLAENRSIFELDDAIGKLASLAVPLVIEALTLRALGDFLALVPATPACAVNQLANSCVVALDDFRKAPDEGELVRRRQNLTPRQEYLLGKWGYPYVFEEFRFHMTLTGRLELPEREQLQEMLLKYLQPILGHPLEFREITLFGDPGNGAPFRLLKRYPLTGSN